MLNKKLLEVLQALSRAEHKKLRLFLRSPYFNSASNADLMLQLYDYLGKYNFEENHALLQKKVVFEFFFREKVFVEREKGPLDALSSDLFKLVRRFMAQQMSESDTEVFQQIALARYYQKHDLEHRFWAPVEAARQVLNQETIRETEHFRLQYMLEEEVTAFYRMHNQIEGDSNLVAAHRSLDLQYLTQKMELLCALSHQLSLSNLDIGAKIPITSIPEEVLQSNSVQEAPVIGIFYMVYQLILDPENDTLFKDFETALEVYKTRISPHKLINFKSYYRYFWSKKYFRSGDENALRKMFEIYRDHYEQGYFFIDGKIHFNALRVLLVYALKNKKFEWIGQVLAKITPQQICGTRYVQEVHSLNLAEYHFYLGEFDAAQDHLIYKNFENPTFGILADVLLIKVYFETDQELIEHRMKALDQKVRRSKLSPELKSRYLQFLSKLNQVIKIQHLKKSPKRDKLLQEIKNTPGIVEREWLLQKANEA
jgi:hypothetical protein